MSGDALKRVFVVGISGYVFTTDKLLSTRVLSVYHPLQKITLQPYILVSKLKKIKTKFLRCTGYLNSIKNHIKQDLLQILVLVQQQNFLNC